MKGSFNQKYEKFKTNVQTLVSQQTELLEGSYLEIKQELMGTSDDKIPSLTPNVTSSSEVPVSNAQENAKDKSQAPKVSVASLITKASRRNNQRSVRVQKWFEDSGAHIVEGKYNALLGNGFSKATSKLENVTRTFQLCKCMRKRTELDSSDYGEF